MALRRLHIPVHLAFLHRLARAVNLVDEADLALRMGDEADSDGPGRRAGNGSGIAHTDPARRPAALDRRQLQRLELGVNSRERIRADEPGVREAGIAGRLCPSGWRENKKRSR